MEPAYDQPIADVASYVFHYEIDEAEERVWERARLALLDAVGCAIETAATSDECRQLLGLASKGTTVPDGFRVPGTSLQVDPLEGTFDLGVLIRYLDHNDALGGAEWGHPSGMMLATLTAM
jgi:2-methylcitrate dehydratase